MIKFIPLGGAGEIGANCYYLNIEGTGILLDCGRNPLRQRRSVEPDGECRFRIFVRRRRDLCAVGELTRNRPGRAAFPPADMRTNAMRPSPLASQPSSKERQSA